jgi:ATP-binding cassette, subfamily F, member 3
MNLLVAENLCLSFGPRAILDGEGFSIAEGDRIGLIGANGTGKTTLLRMIAGLQTPDDGALHFSKGVTIGYLPQDILELPDKTLRRFVQDAAPGRGDLERNIKEVEAELQIAKEQSQQEKLAESLAHLHERLLIFQSIYSPHEAESILMGLGFKPQDLPRKLTEFSGGWRMRAALAGLLFRKPDLLLLDEPTNHLDVATVEWFDDFLHASEFALILVSHDREFLDRQIKKVASFEFEGLRFYTGDYESYLKQREEEKRQLFATAKNVEDKKRQLSRFVTRFRAKNTKAKQVKSKIREIERLKEIDLPQDRKTLRFTFPPTSRSGKDVIIAKDLTKNYPGVKVFEGLDVTVYRGDRIAIIGDNGAGKTTLLKILAGEMKQDSGEASLGHRVELGYYAQHHGEALDPKKTVLDEVWSVMPDVAQNFVRGVCGSFLFSGDDVEKHTAVLSGGEKARVALAKLLVKPGNLLMMDEPTNHLDLWSSEALAEALTTYDGTLVFVSHNRAFVNRLADKVWDLRDGRIEPFPGNLDDYLHHQKLLKKAEDAAPETAKKGEAFVVPGNSVANKEDKKDARRRRAARREIELQKFGPVQKKVKDLEKRIAEQEKRYAELEELLADPAVYDDHAKSGPLLTEFSAVKGKLEELMARWEHQCEIAENIRAELDAQD